MNNSDIIITLIDLNAVFISEEHKLLPSFFSAIKCARVYDIDCITGV